MIGWSKGGSRRLDVKNLIRRKERDVSSSSDLIGEVCYGVLSKKAYEDECLKGK